MTALGDFETFAKPAPNVRFQENSRLSGGPSGASTAGTVRLRITVSGR